MDPQAQGCLGAEGSQTLAPNPLHLYETRRVSKGHDKAPKSPKGVQRAEKVDKDPKRIPKGQEGTMEPPWDPLGPIGSCWAPLDPLVPGAHRGPWDPIGLFVGPIGPFVGLCAALRCVSVRSAFQSSCCAKVCS